MNSTKAFFIVPLLTGALLVSNGAVPKQASSLQEDTPTPFSLLDEDGSSPSDLSSDTEIAPLRIGLSPVAMINEDNVLGLVLRHLEFRHQLWLFYFLVTFGLLTLAIVFGRIFPDARTPRSFLAIGAALFCVFAFFHWQMLEGARGRQALLTKLVSHAVADPAVPELFVALTARLQPFSQKALLTTHLILDAIVLGLLLFFSKRSKNLTSSS